MRIVVTLLLASLASSAFATTCDGGSCANPDMIEPPKVSLLQTQVKIQEEASPADSPKKTSLIPPPAPGTNWGGPFEYTGCFQANSGDVQDLQGPYTNLGTGGADYDIPGECFQYCVGGGYEYFGLQPQSGSVLHYDTIDFAVCYCGNDIGSFSGDLGVYAPCDKACTGSTYLTCGGIGTNTGVEVTYNSIYKILGDAPAPPPGTCHDAMIGGSSWTDSDGEDCGKYSSEGWCGASWQASYANDGKTADVACCACGGGGEGICQDAMIGGSSWTDSDGEDCGKYSSEGWCGASWQASYANDGKTADVACCACGGGA